MKMKLLGSNPWRGNTISRVFSALFNPTKAFAASSSSAAPPFEPLHARILRYGNRRVSVLPALRQWLEEGRELKKPELQDLIKKLRKFSWYGQALQISEWMVDELNHDAHPVDIATRLDLISKVHGLEIAEKYFESIPESLRVVQVYGSLLYCYAMEKHLEKAEALFENMKKLNLVKGPVPYNTMLTLYSQMGKHRKVDILVREMEEKGIYYNVQTLTIRLYSYAATSDVARMEKLLMKMEADPLVIMDWHCYAVAANAFLKAGQLEKASALLRKSEKLISGKRRKIGFEYLMTSHAAIGNKHEVYRIWDLYKSMVGFYNNGYRCVLSSLLRMDDFDGAEKILQEWECGNKHFDVLIPNLLISAYCRKGHLEKAKSYVKKLSEGGNEDFTTLTVLASGYHTNGQIAEAVETFKRAANLPCRRGWKFNRATLAACFEYLKDKGDVEVAHELLRFFRERGHLPTGLCDKIGSYIDGGEAPGLE